MNSDRVSGFQLEVLAAPWLNHAMVHVGLPFLHRVVIDPSRLLRPPRELCVTIAVTDGFGEQVSVPWQRVRPDPDISVVVEIDRPGLHFDAAAIAAVEEESAGEVTVRVAADGFEVGELHSPIRILPARHWLFDPEAQVLSLELLAAFVQPNHPAIGPVVARAAEILEKQTGSGSLAVSHHGPERIDAVVQSVFSAAHELDIVYAEPPASWGLGQKVRGPGEVLTDRIGTCLDTTVTLAAVLEHLGIAPVLWIARGHAFLGYWREPRRGLPDAASCQVATAANAVDLELIGVVETTMVTRERRPPKNLFRRATRAVRDHYFAGAANELVGVVDVAMARMLGLHPLASRRTRSDGVVEVIEYTPAAPGLGLPIDPADADSGTPQRSLPAARAGRTDQPEPPPRIQGWKNALLDLSLRNRLLNQAQPGARIRLLLPGGEMGHLGGLMQAGRAVALRALDDLAGAVLGEQIVDAHALPGEVQRAMLRNRSTLYSEHAGAAHRSELDRLRLRARAARQETGANTMLLGLGRLDWQLGERELSAPLVLLPIDLLGLIQPYRMEMDSSGEVTVNLSLLEKMRVEFGFEVPDLAELPLTDDGLVDIAEVLRRFRSALRDSGLPFRVEEEAQLSISTFTGYLLWRDLDQHWQRFLERPLVRHLVHHATEAYADPALSVADSADADPTADPLAAAAEPDLDEVTAIAPIPADGSQAAAIAWARAGRSFVLEGPPGTGKSQTITNILADQLVQGRTVLFVAEKGAALDVVRNRLAQVGLLPYTLDLHDHAARPTEIKARLRSALAQTPMVDREGYRGAVAELHSTTGVLRGYRDRLHRRNPAGLSLWSARNQQLGCGAGATLSVDPRAVATADFDDEGLRRAVAAAVAALSELRMHTILGWGFAGSEGADEASVLRAAEELDRLVAANPVPPGPAQRARTVDELAAVVQLLGEPGLGSELRALGTPAWEQEAAALLEATQRLGEAAAGTLVRFDPAVIDLDLTGVRQGLREAALSFFIGRKGRLLRAAAPMLTHLRPGQQIGPKELPQLADRIAELAAESGEVRARWRRLAGMAESATAVIMAERDSIPVLRDGLDRMRRAAASLATLSPTLADEVVTTRRQHPDPDPALAGIEPLLSAWRRLVELTGSRTADQRRFSGEAGILAAWKAGEQARGESGALGVWRRASNSLRPLQGVAEQARWELLCGAVAADQAPAAWDRGVAAAAYAERWQQAGFEDFHAPAQDRAAADFVAASARLREQLTTVLPAALLEGRPFRPGRTVGRAAALERELNRTRGGLSVRRLLSEYGSVIAEVTPCILVSPDSLARFIAPDAMDFDLAVFDEASQIRVPDAIGALGRARACVIAGDSKQLPPTAFAQSHRGEDIEALGEEFEILPDEESILSEGVQAGLPRRWLSWHYRSTDESLIAFSNANYYQDKLSSFPAFPATHYDTGMSFTRIAGHFRRSTKEDRASQPPLLAKGLLRTNPVEATAVVEEVLRRWSQRERSIGVVTFNVQQRNLIQSMLWDSESEGVRESLLSNDGLFVKNLENVQGDERDVIIFSTAFSANASGVLPLNFGPLNRAGGERRLNVAITRARRRVMVFCSFDPEDLRVEQTSSVGLHHLRAYLELARDGVLPRVSTRPPSVDRHRDQIADALRERGLQVQVGVGLSDFRIDLQVSDPDRGERSSVAVLLDGADWAVRATVSDRDGLPEQVLATVMGWPAVVRIWLPEWISGPTAVLDRVVATVAAVDGRSRSGESQVNAIFAPYPVGGGSAVLDSGEPIGRSDTAAPAKPDDEGAEDPADIPPDPLSLLDSQVDVADEGDYREPEPELLPKTGLDRAPYVAGHGEELERLLRGIVDQAGPMSVPRLARLVVRSYGISRLQESRIAQVRAAIPADLRRDGEGFVWPAARDPLRWRGFRRSVDSRDRPLSDIALREIINAQYWLVEQAMGIQVEELAKETAALFGISRVTKPVLARLGEALDLAQRQGLLLVRDRIVTCDLRHG